MSQTDWLVRLPVFQGPLDLLLFLVRRAEVDIHDIEIHTLTDQYLESVRHIARLDIDLAGEFLVMAATLVELKSRALTPSAPSEFGETSSSSAPGDDPKSELIRQLLAYQRFRTAAEGLDARRREFGQRGAARARPGVPDPTAESAEDANADGVPSDWELEDLHLGDLFAAFESVAASIDLTRIGDHQVEYDDTPISLHQEDLMDRLVRNESRMLTLESVFEGRTHSERIGLFLAMLELVRQGRVRVSQDCLEDPIEVTLDLEHDPNAPTFESSTASLGGKPEVSKN